MKLLIILSLFLMSCTKTVYVPVERTSTVTKTERDTIIKVRLEKEHVFVKSRDTLVVAETKYVHASAEWGDEQLSLELRNKDVEIPVITKYIYITQRDSVPYPEPYPVPTPYTTTFDKIMRWIGGGSTGLLLLSAVFKRRVI